MNSKLEALMSAYQSKPKKPVKKKAKPVPKLVTSETSQKINNKRAPINISFKASSRRENQSVEPKRSGSTLSLIRYLNSSFDEDMERLESLTNKNSNISSDWVNVKQRMIELNMKKNLNPIVEIDESGTLDNIGSSLYYGHLPLNLTKNYDSLMDLKVKEKHKSTDNLLLIR